MLEMFDRIGQQAHFLLLLLTRVLDTAIKSQPESKSDPGPEDIKPNKTSRTGALSQGRDIIGPIHPISQGQMMTREMEKILFFVHKTAKLCCNKHNHRT